jgi:hypothetical protein
MAENCMPFAQLIERQRAQLGDDPRPDRRLGAIGRLPAAALVVREIVDDRLSHNVRVVEPNEIACGFPHSRLEPVPRPGLRLPEVEHGLPVGLARVVGSAERFETPRPILVAEFENPGAALGAAAIAKSAPG